jgi:spore germination protein GerM
MMRRTWTWRRLLVLTCALLLLTGCGVGAQSGPTLLDPSAAPLRGLLGTPSPAPTGSARALIYLNRDGTLVAVVRRVPAPAATDQVFAALVIGPTEREQQAGLASSVPVTWHLADGSPSRGVVRIEIASTGSTAGRNDEVLAFAQAVLTLGSLPGVTGVQFVQDSKVLPVPRADGSLVSTPVSRGDYAALL